MSNTNPLASYVVDAQEIVMQARRPGADPAAAIERLAGLLCTPATNRALIDAVAPDDSLGDQAPYSA